MKILSYLLITFSFLVLFSSCSGEKNDNLKQGEWRGVLLIDKNDESAELPFNFSYTKSDGGKSEIIITNADEKVSTNEIIFSGDSIFIKMPVFKDEIRAKIMSEDSLSGQYYHFGSRSQYSFGFNASAGKKQRFTNADKTPSLDISGRWETTVQPGDSDEYKIIGEFLQSGNHLTGTFLTTSGDYRYLEGAVSGNDVMLSCADGSHTLLFKAIISAEGTLENGVLIGGPTWREKWRAVRNEKAVLPDPEKQSAVKENTGEINFTFTDLNNKKVSLSDEKYKGKAVIVQIMGSWCPNCMDETKLFAQLFETYKPKGLEIIGLCFESKDFEESKTRIERFVRQLNAKYDFLYAGEVGINSIFALLPFMKEFRGYPTTLYLDRNHKVRKVFTGFSGPGTGKHYEKLKNDIVQYIEELIK